MNKITGIKKITSRSLGLHPYGYGHTLQIVANRETGRAWCIEHVSPWSYTVFQDPDIITAGYLDRPSTMAEIQRMIENALAG